MKYWDEVAAEKKFTHPLMVSFIEKYFRKDDLILDYECGCGCGCGCG
jgi:hypothetical protein